jgi:uncharacterized repeat protein (TIGR04138 family)
VSDDRDLMATQPVKPLDQIVREVGKYKTDAFMFVQECIGLATDRVHGPMSPEAAGIAGWMAQQEIAPDELLERWQVGDLPPEIIEAINELGGPEKLNRHVTGQQLCEVIRDIARERWGLMARSVLARWGVHRTEDIGQIVFALVNNAYLQKQPTDSIEDFNNVFKFSDAFDRSYRMLE